MIGRSLSKYRILDKLGEGGMGVVWKALDTQLEREVAIKVLPEEFVDDPERLARFEREAKVLASLNHRNIASLYGLEEAEGKRFLVMELVEGEDLAERLRRGALPVDEALDVCHQLSRALEAAHERGVLHRDLKPANVQISHEGRVKVLDFGLAKALESDSASQRDATMSPTLTSAGTRAGMILGTAPYMSPEQARAKPLDKRTDIWSFGCLLYECLTARSPFVGETISDILASLLKTEPDWAILPAQTPPRVRELLQRCLEKDVRNRLRDIGDARLELQRSIAGHESTIGSSVTMYAAESAPRRSTWSTWVGWVLAGVVGAGVGIGVWQSWSGSPTRDSGAAAKVARFSIEFPSEMLVNECMLSPDGSAIAYAGTPRQTSGSQRIETQIFVRPIDEYEARRVEGADGAQNFTFSPDGRWLVVRVPIAPGSSKYRLSKIPVDGSAPPLVMHDWRDDWWGPLLWLPDGDLIARTRGGKSLVRIPTDGRPPGEPVPITAEGYEGAFGLQPQNGTVLPDGAHVLGSVTSYGERGWDTSVAILDVNTGAARVLVENADAPRWSSTGHVVFTRGDALLATALDLGKMTPTGETVAIADGFRACAVYCDTWFDLATDGTMIHWPGGLFGDRRQLAFVDGDFNLGEPWSEDHRYFEGGLAVSQDGRRMAVGVVNDASLYETWISDMDVPRLTRFVSEPRLDCVPRIWTPDGESLLYDCSTNEKGTLYTRRVDDGGEARAVITTTFPESYRPNAFLPDGTTLVLQHFKAGDTDLELLPTDDRAREASPAPFIEDARNASVSPDGRWIAYESDASGRNEIYLRRLRPDGSVGREIPATTVGAATPHWRQAGDSRLMLRYVSSQVKAFEVAIHDEEAVTIGEPVLLRDLIELSDKVTDSAWMSDGRYLAVLKDEGERRQDRIHVVLNWTTELQGRLGSTR